MPVVQYGSGSLRHRITFSERNDVEDEYGNVTTGWVDRFTVAANITARLGGEAVEAARLAGRQVVVITVRRSINTRQVTPDWKVKDIRSGVEYNIRTAIDPNIGNNKHDAYIDMLAESGVAI